MGKTVTQGTDHQDRGVTLPAEGLVALQQDVQQVCLATAPPSTALARLGDERIWLLYREMVRRRLYGELKNALRRTYAEAGEALFSDAFARHLAEDPPHDRRFYGIVACFAKTAIAHFAQTEAAAPHLADLARFEATRWEVSDLDGRLDSSISVGELNFDGRPILSPALRVLSLRHAVHFKPRDGAYRSGRFFLAVHRASDELPVRQWTLNRSTYELIRDLQANPDHTLTEAVQAVSRKLQVVVDEPFLDGLCTVLSDFVERRILLGSCT
ncbi:MAG: hypothetical protein OXR73_31650 [Myxococcales bacterium]|nr:hypothetical protein [Myxococcales bacterium]